MYRNYDFLSLYYKSCGDTEVPKGYHGWCGLALIAAVLENRVWFEKLGTKLTPNLYIFLIGPASIGKGQAISVATRLLKQADIPVNLFRGKTTAAFLLDLLGRPIVRDNETIQPDNRLWLIMDELANDLGQVKQADDFIKMMTEMFTATDYSLNTGTRTDGFVTINKPCINWLIGTTKEWMFDVMTKQTIYSGFTARVLFCFRDYIDLRHARPEKPEDHEKMIEALVNKIRVLYSLSGPMVFDTKTEVIHDNWYYSRKVPEESLLLPAWKRGHDIILKLAMLFSLSENTQMVIRQHHLKRAITTFDNAFQDLDKMINLACGTAESEELDKVGEFIKRHKKVNRTRLTRSMWRHKINTQRIDHYVNNLEQRSLIKVTPMAGGGKLYLWIGD